LDGSDLKWHERVEELIEFARIGEREGWDIDFSVGQDGLPEISIRRARREVKSLRDLLKEFL